MARKKKIEPITGISKDPESKLMVQKSRPLFALWRSGLTLAEFKILDTYLSRIDSKKPEKRAVLFEKGELEQLLGVKKINNSELQERLTHLMGNVVKVDDPTKTKSYRLVSLFEEAVAEQDEHGLWEVRLECTQKAMKYFFNIDNLGYLRYKLRCITSIGSRYSYILFMYLEANRFRKSWEVSIDELKLILDCQDTATYNQFKDFNKLLLKRCQKELHEKTECVFVYEPIKKGRSVVAVRFT
ncbi:MAG: replication initiation protein, partial [Eubacteriales bacterium]